MYIEVGWQWNAHHEVVGEACFGDSFVDAGHEQWVAGRVLAFAALGGVSELDYFFNCLRGAVSWPQFPCMAVPQCWHDGGGLAPMVAECCYC